MGRGIIRSALPKISEATSLFYPWHLFWRDEVLAGRLPFWNPFMFGGFPIVAEPQAQTFYPAHVLALVLAPDTAFTLNFLLHVLLATWLMYRLVRELGAARCGAALSGLAFGLQGQISAFIFQGWIGHLAPMAWAPGVVWMTCRAFRDPRGRPGRAIAIGGAFLGIQTVSGHPEWVRDTIVMLSLLVVAGQDLAAGFRRRLAIAGSIVALGLLIGSVQLVPFAQLAGHTDRGRQALTTGAVRRGAGLPLVTLPTMIAPRLFGPWDTSITANGVVHKLSGSGSAFSESLIYVGVLPLVLAFVGWRGRKKNGAGVWAFIAAAGLLLASNDWTHLVTILDRVVRPDAAFHTPARWVFLTNFSLAVLAGLGLSRLQECAGAAGAAARWSRVLALILAAGGAGVWLLRRRIVERVVTTLPVPFAVAADRRVAVDGGRSLGLWAIDHAVLSLAGGVALLLVASWAIPWAARRLTTLRAAAIIAITAVDLGAYAYPFLRSLVPVEDVYAADARLLSPVTGEPRARIASATQGVLEAGDDATVVLRVRSLLGYDGFALLEWDRLMETLGRATPNSFASIGVTHLIVERQPGQRDLVALPDARGHAWWTSRAGPAAAGDASVRIERDVPGELDAIVDARRPGSLIFSEVRYPGWIATVNGRRETIEPALDALQAVQLPAGRSSVRIRFQPAVVMWGAGLTLAGILLAATIWRTAGRGAISPAGRSLECRPPEARS